jgi:hypothetical protein
VQRQQVALEDDVERHRLRPNERSTPPIEFQ